jgi:hypothetical protein
MPEKIIFRNILNFARSFLLDDSFWIPSSFIKLWKNYRYLRELYFNPQCTEPASQVKLLLQPPELNITPDVTGHLVHISAARGKLFSILCTCCTVFNLRSCQLRLSLSRAPLCIQQIIGIWKELRPGHPVQYLNSMTEPQLNLRWT